MRCALCLVPKTDPSVPVSQECLGVASGSLCVFVLFAGLPVRPSTTGDSANRHHQGTGLTPRTALYTSSATNPATREDSCNQRDAGAGTMHLASAIDGACATNCARIDRLNGHWTHGQCGQSAPHRDGGRDHSDTNASAGRLSSRRETRLPCSASIRQ